MPVLLSNEAIFYLSDLKITPLTLMVEQGDEQRPLQQKPMEVLCFLAEQYPALVTREQLIDAVWDGNVYVGEKALTNAIWQLRQLFSQCGQPDLIMTVRKKGYRLQQAPRYCTAPPEREPAQVDIAAAAPATPTRTSRQHIWLLAALLLSIAAIAAVLSWPSAQNQLTQITRLQGWAQHPSVTPDGHWLVYSWQGFGQTADLYLLDLQTPGAVHRQLTFSSDEELRPQLSADARQVYFSSRNPDDGSCLIKRLEISTLQETVLDTCGRHNDVYLELSPNQHYLYFNGSRGALGSGLYRLDVTQANAKPEELPCKQHCDQRVRDIAVAPDHQSLAITRRANRLAEEIYHYDLATAAERQLTHGQSDIRGLSFTPDGQRILYSADVHGKNQSYLLDITTASSQQQPIDDVSFVSNMTHDGQMFFHRDSSVPQLGYIQLQQPSAIFPLSAGDVSFQAPAFHHDQLLFLSSESGQNELWLADGAMQQKKQLTQLAAVLKYPLWSPDGDTVLLLSRAANTTVDRVTLVDTTTGKLQFVDTGLVLNGRPAWTHTDEALLLPTSKGIWRFNLRTGDKQLVSTMTANAIQMLDDRGFYFSKGRGKGLWWQALTPSTQDGFQAAGPAVQVLDGEQFSESYCWVADAQGVYFLQPNANSTAVQHYQFQSRQLDTLVVLPSEQLDLSTRLALDSHAQRLIVQYSPIPRVDIWRWQTP